MTENREAEQLDEEAEPSRKVTSFTFGPSAVMTFRAFRMRRSLKLRISGKPTAPRARRLGIRSGYKTRNRWESRTFTAHDI